MGNGPRVDCSGDAPLTQQSGKDECDINVIVERAKRGADLSKLTRGDVPIYGDFTEIPTDLRDCLNSVRRADALFMSLDAVVRRRFENDPANLLDFLNDPNNRDEAISLGLVKAPVAPVVDESLETLKSIDVSLKEKGRLSGRAKAKADADD